MVEYRALKLLKLDEETEGWPITSLREIVILKRMNHKNIVPLIDVFVKNRTKKDWRKHRIYIVFEFVPHDLAGLI